MGIVIDLGGNGGGTGTGWEGEVNTFADLPAAADNTGLVYLVKTTTGSLITFNLRRSGFYQSDGATWGKISPVVQMFKDDELTFQDGTDNTKQLGFQLDNISTSTRRIATFQDKDGTVAYLSDLPGQRNNYVLVKSKSDLPAPVGGVITLADNTSYEINGTIVLGTDRIVSGVSNAIYGIDKSDDILVFTGTASAMITATNQDLTIRGVTLISSGATSEIFNITGSGTNRVEIAECIFANSVKVGSITGGLATTVFRNNLVTGCADGLFITGTNDDLFITDNLFEGFTGTATAVSIQGTVTYHTIIVSRNMWEISAGQTGLDIDSNITFTGGGLIVHNSFEDGGTYLNGINASSLDWDIPSRSNIGIAGLRIFNITMVLQAWATTSATYLEIPETQSIKTATFYEPNATTIEATISSASVSHDQSGNRTDIELYNLSDAASVAGSEIQTTITTAGVYQVVSNGGSFYSLLEDKEYRMRLRRGTGSGQNDATIRSCTLEIRVY